MLRSDARPVAASLQPSTIARLAAAALRNSVRRAGGPIPQDQLLQLGRKTVGGIAIATLQQPASNPGQTAS